MNQPPDPGTVTLIFLLLISIAWGATWRNRAVQHKADRDRLNRCLKDAIKQFNNTGNSEKY